MTMKPTEDFVEDICDFLDLDQKKFLETLEHLRSKEWERWGGGTVEVTVAEILYCLIRIMDPRGHVIDGGTNWGYSAAHMAEALKDNKREYSLTTIDIDKEAQDKAREFLNEKGLEKYIQYVLEDSVKVLEGIRIQYEFVFIDTSHEYGHTKKEFYTMYRRCMIDGNDNFTFLFHDAVTDAYGVKQFLEEIKPFFRVLILDTQPNTGLAIVRMK